MNEDEQEKKLEQELRDGLNDMEQTDEVDETVQDEPDESIKDEETVVDEPSEPVSDPEPAAMQPVEEKAPEQTPAKDVPTHSNAGTVILQWLSYAFWAWLVIGLIWLVNVSLSSVLIDADTSSIIPYALAASVVLLPVAFVTDLFYRKREPIKKHSAAMVIMVIHAVLYALATIGTLIGAVFIAINMFINDQLSLNNPESVVLYTTLFAALAFGFVFLRVLNPFKSTLFAKVFSIVMLVISAGLIVFGFVGPAMNAYNLRDDRLIESGLGTISSSISTYVTENDKLPESLKELTIYDKDGAALVEKNLVEYKPEGKVEPVKDEDNVSSEDYSQYRYQVCVTYKKEAKNDPGYSYGGPEIYPGGDGSDDYQSYPDTYNHKAGDVCYKLETYNYKDQPIGL